MTTDKNSTKALSKPGSQISINLNSNQQSRNNVENPDGLETYRSAILERAMGSIYFKEKLILTPEN
jgi:hypothetical protein